MRVVHIVPALFSSDGGIIGGAERHVMELGRHMAGKIPTTIVSFGDKDRNESLGDLKIRVLGNAHYVKGQRSNPIAFRSLIPLLRRGDVIHCHQQYVMSSSFAALYSRLTGRRVFVSDLGGGGWDISSYISTDRLYHGHLHISEYSRKIFGQANSRRAHVVLGAVDTDKFSPDTSVAKSGNIIFVGRLLPHKGVNYLIEALTPDLKLELIGQIYDKRHFEDLQKLACGKLVTFRHDCDDQMLVNAYRKSLCVVLPSVYRNMYGVDSRVPELLGQALLEGMSCGLPGICTDVASMPEVVQDGISGFIVPPNNSEELGKRLTWLRDHPKEASEMGTSARQRVLTKFTWPLVVQRHLEAYGCQ